MSSPATPTLPDTQHTLSEPLQPPDTATHTSDIDDMEFAVYKDSLFRAIVSYECEYLVLRLVYCVKIFWFWFLTISDEILRSQSLSDHVTSACLTLHLLVIICTSA